MILLSLAIVCLSVVLPLHAASFQDRPKWFATEVQVPSEQTGLNPVIDGEKLKIDTEFLQRNKTKLNAEEEEVKAREKELKAEKELHMKKTEALNSEKKGRDKIKMKVKAMKKALDELKERKNLLEKKKKVLAKKKTLLANAKRLLAENVLLLKRKNEILERRKALRLANISLNTDLNKHASETDEYTKKNKEVDDQLGAIEAKSKNLESLYENCQTVFPELELIIPGNLGKIKLCY